MTYKFASTKRVSLFSEEIKIFFLKRFIEMGGLVLIMGGLTTFISLLAYHSTDTSLNTLSPGPIQNIMGPLGSYLSDFLFQVFGGVAFTLPLLLVCWGIHMVLLRHIPHMKWRLLTYIAAVVALCVASSVFGNANALISGILSHGLDSLASVIGSLPVALGKLVLGAMGLAAYVWVLNVPKAVWQWIGQKIGQGGIFLWHSIRKIFFKEAFAETVPSSVVQETFSTEELILDDHEVEEGAIQPRPLAISVREGSKPVMGGVVHFKLENSTYKTPPLDLLQEDTSLKIPPVQKQVLQEQADKLLAVLQDFGVQGEIANVYPGPVVTLYEFKPAPGMKSSRIISLSDDIARSMSAVSARIANIPGYNALGIELPNTVRQTVYMRCLLADQNYAQTGAKLPLILGKNISGEPTVADLGKMPHLLVAGTTGSGKSVAVNAMILSLLYKLSPEQCKFIMIDPKMLELSVYDGIPHLLAPVVTDPHKAVMALKWAVREMEARYQIMSKLGVRNIEGYNERMVKAKQSGENITHRVQTGFDAETGKPVFEEQSIELKLFPFIVIIVDEMADLMLVAGKEIEAAVQRLAQMARAAGIHLIMATQRPSVDVITGTIKANFPTRISFQVTSKIDSRTILGEQGAEQLLGQGDMLYMAPGGRIARVHGPFVRDQEVERIVQFLKNQGEPQYEVSVTSEEEEGSLYEGGASGDSLYDQALSIVLQERKISTSFIQRHLQIGYNRAARIVEKMEQEGVVSKPNHVGKREILIQ